MPSRRQFLRAAGLAATLPGLALGQAGTPTPSGAPAAAKKAKPPPGSGILVNDVHAQLSSARVFAIEQPVDLDGVRKAIELARTEEKNVCFAGARHSMGGQPFAEDGVLVDTRKLNRVLNLDLERGRLEVEAGILWPQLLQGLAAMQRGREQPWTVLQRQTGAERLTVGGSLSSNMHGAGLVLAPFVSDVESFRLLDAKGDVLNCSRSENPDLFRLVAGGYGLFGLVHTVTLRLAPRRRLERVVELRDAAGIAAAFQSRIQEGFLYGDFTLSLDDKAPDFLSRGVLSCFRPAAPDQPAPERPARELSDRDWIELLYLAHVNKGEAFRRYAAYAQSTQGQLYWSDELPMTVFPENYHREVDRRREAERRSTETMCEIFCERERLEAFLADVRATARIERLDLIHCSVRLIEQDRESFLAWARKSYACITFHLHVEHNSSGTIRAGDQLRRLIDIGIKHGGSYYPTYHRYALRRQLDACFPQFQDFLKLKRKYDPQELFQSDWYRHYKKMYFGT